MSIKYLRYPDTVGPMGPTGAPGPQGVAGPTGPVGPAGQPGSDASALFLSAFFYGPTYIHTGTTRQYVWKSGTVSMMQLVATAAPVGGPITVRVNKNGSQVALISLPSGSTYVKITNQTFTFALDDWFSLDIIAVGTTFPGSNLTVQLIT